MGSDPPRQTAWSRSTRRHAAAAAWPPPVSDRWNRRVRDARIESRRIEFGLRHRACPTPTNSGFAARGTTAVSCVGYFVAHVRSGPDAGRGYHGDISMTIPADPTAGPRALLALYAKDARPRARGYQGRPIAQVPTSVTISGTAWTMVFHLPSGQVISGTGTITKTIRACRDTPMSGTLAGPRPGDRGDWDCVHDERWQLLQDTQTQTFEIQR